MIVSNAERRVLLPGPKPSLNGEPRFDLARDSRRDSDPTTHFAFVLQIRLTEFRGKISLFAKDDAVMKNQRERDDKQQRDPVVEKKAERDLH